MLSVIASLAKVVNNISSLDFSFLILLRDEQKISGGVWLVINFAYFISYHIPTFIINKNVIFNGLFFIFCAEN